MASWWEYEKPAGAPGTHAAGDDGEDLSTPDRTPVYLPFAGQVIDTSYHDYGGQVVVKVAGAPYDEYAIHMNGIAVHKGDRIAPDTYIGDSGGGVGDLVLHDGSIQPAQDMSWYHGHSTGYHSEFGLFRDDKGGDMGEFNRGWGNRGRQMDPRPIIDAEKQKNMPPPPPPSGDPGSNSNPLDPRTWASAVGRQFLQAAGFSSLQNMALRVAVGAAGVGLALGGVWVAIQPEAQKELVQVAGAAAKAAL